MACVPTMTLLTLDIIANIAESVISVVSILAFAKAAANCWPLKYGADSATITWNFLPFSAAPFKNISTVLDLPTVRITSDAWMWSNAKTVLIGNEIDQ